MLTTSSILESCQTTFREVRRLKWHYRSRCESLIRFSNENFYRDNPLITFPAAKPGSFSIDLIRVAGNYQFRRNVAEAAVVVQKAVEIMRGYAHLDSEDIPTVGIVSLNVDQRDLLQEELNRVSAEISWSKNIRKRWSRRESRFSSRTWRMFKATSGIDTHIADLRMPTRCHGNGTAFRSDQREAGTPALECALHARPHSDRLVLFV